MGHETRATMAVNIKPLFFYRTADIRKAIAAIMDPKAGRRVAIVAYIGGDAVSFIPKPRGAAIYCAPNTIGTNPAGLEDLLNRMGDKPDLFFVTSLHMKIYWSANAGAFVGSANLSANALQDGGLYEAGIYFPQSSMIDIDTVLAALPPAKPVTPKRLARFWRQWNAARTARHKGQQARASRVPDLTAYARNPFRQPFKIAVWTEQDPQWSLSAQRAVAKSEHIDISNAETYIDDEIEDQHPGLFRRGDWALAVRLNDTYTKVLRCDWTFASHVLSPRRKEGSRGRQRIIDTDAPHRDTVPFTFANRRLRAALNAVLRKRPQLFDRGFVPKSSDIDELAAAYAKLHV